MYFLKINTAFKNTNYSEVDSVNSVKYGPISLIVWIQ